MVVTVLTTAAPVGVVLVQAAVVLDKKGTAVNEIQRSGHVLDLKQLADEASGAIPVRRHGARPARSFALKEAPGGEARDPPACTAVSFAPHHNCIVLGYRDGFVQLYDVNKQRVCRRINAHATPVVRAWLVPDQMRLFSMSLHNTLRIDAVCGRNIRASGKVEGGEADAAGMVA